jgi:hypothetical protein
MCSHDLSFYYSAFQRGKLKSYRSAYHRFVSLHLGRTEFVARHSLELEPESVNVDPCTTAGLVSTVRSEVDTDSADSESCAALVRRFNR